MLGLLLVGAWLGAPSLLAAYSVQEAILRVKPAVVLITTEVRGDVTLNCGRGPTTVTPAPYIETGTGDWHSLGTVEIGRALRTGGEGGDMG